MGEGRDTPKGFALAVTVYGLWGFLPLYLGALGHIPPVEVIAHRVLWSLPIAGLVLLATGRGRALLAAIREPRVIGMAVVTATLVSVNWGIYVWAVGSGHALDAALGYYINPLFSVFLGAVLLRERLGAIQWAAIALAAAGVVVLTVESGRVPVAALGLTFSWGFYAFFKRRLPVGPNEGFFLEVLVLLAPALAYLGFLAQRGEGHFLTGSGPDAALLLGCGVVTAVPLMLYANAAKGLRLSTIGILQYIAPTLVTVVAVTLMGEEFGRARAIAFPMIWAALAFYSVGLLTAARAGGASARVEAVSPPLRDGERGG